ncbi:hypothetical protein MPL3365_140085 [Mesorhizobium plurifarium]|uniref:Uncharacterized protein n=1 Tax=Mesorhizobium plurifarium TaxID=69974 RepID=A0A090GT20_MESPL|nr:hypothetical protein MPL3365_140085 [Mesorhizobium plurifarium]
MQAGAAGTRALRVWLRRAGLASQGELKILWFSADAKLTCSPDLTQTKPNCPMRHS